MCIKRLLEENRISRETLIRRLNNRLIGFSLDERFLSKYENEEIAADRRSAIEDAIRAEFPEHKETEAKLPHNRVWPKISWHSILNVVLIVFVVVSVSSFFIFRDNPIWEDFEKFIGLLAALAGIVGIFIGLDWWKKR